MARECFKRVARPGGFLYIGPLRRAFIIVWIVLTVASAAAAAAPFVLDAEIIHRLTPPCERRATTGQPCSFCGMTTAFLDIGHGDLDGARNANAGALPLFSVFCLNTAVLAGWLVRSSWS